MDCGELSHLDMSGGKIFLRPEQELEFIYRYSRRLETERMCLSEVATAVCAAYFDLDFKGRSLNEDEVRSYCEVIQNCIVHLEPRPHACQWDGHDERSRVSPSTAVVAWSRREKKTGVHLVFPGLVVNKHQLPRLALYVRAELRKKFPEVAWSEVVDTGVYSVTGGLRMVGSYKAKKVDGTKVADVDNGRYSFLFTLRDGDECDPTPFKYKESEILALSVRHNPRCTPCKIKIPKVEGVFDGAGAGTGGGARKKIKVGRAQEATSTSSSSQATPLPTNTETSRLVSALVKGQPGWQSASVGKLLRLDCDTIVAHVEGTKFCPRAKRQHKNSPVFMMIHRARGLSRNCRSAHCTNAKKVWVPVRPSLLDKIFEGICIFS